MVIRRSLSLILAVLAVYSVNIFHQPLTFVPLAGGVEANGKSQTAADFQPPVFSPANEGMPSLSGEKAVTYLKEQGGYDSLGDAIAAARYSANWANTTRIPTVSGGAYEADNPAQGFTSYFTPEGVHLVAAGEGTPAWFLEMKLQGIGYGDKLGTVSAGVPAVTSNRVELVRNSALSPEPLALALNSSLIPHPSSLALTSAPSPEPPALIEWYENGPEGLEQGLTLSAPPGERSGPGRLRVAFELGGNLKARLVSGGQAIDFCNEQGQQVLLYNKLVVTDAQKRRLAARMKLEAGQVVLEIDDQEAVYPVIIDPTFGQQTKLTASDGAADDLFGCSVAISGETVVVGAYQDTIGANDDQGSAYVFVRSGTTWSLQQKLTASDGMALDQFGFSAAINGETVVVGAYQDTIGANDGQGSVYVFVRSGTIWSQQQKLTASDGMAIDQLGFSVAISGEVVVAGARFDNIGANNDQGSAYVFVRSGTTWSQRQKLTASDGAAGDWFGTSVAINGETVVVGAPLDTIGANNLQGSAYVFVQTGTTWTEQQKLTASDGAVGDQFGGSVAISGETVVVGAPVDTIGANNLQGSASVFVRSGTTWSEQQKLTISDGAVDDRFGFSVAISGETVVVGALLDDIDANSDQGSAAVFVRTGTTWTEQQKLTASDGEATDFFGSSVAISGETVVVGASFDTVGANTDQGSASVFTCPATTQTWIQQAMSIATDGAAGDGFGISVAISGETVVVGAPFDDIGANTNQGSAYVFVRSGTTWSQQQQLTASDGAVADGFGFSVSVSGETVVVGANQDDIGAATNQGSAYVFVRSGTTWS
ncbi:MAG TPA: FG-GAP repeat protein, partial [Acidobacteriota bacterium]|nr:FG-GAP repeat protein [Acidobacteriota bacterium]